MPTSRYVDFRAVKQAVSMVQVLDHYGLTERFQRKADSLSGACPLHKGENPTQFRVSVSKNCWNCFGDCKRGGNVLDFVSLMDGVTIREAAIRVSDWFNVVSEKPEKKSSASEDKKPVPSIDKPLPSNGETPQTPPKVPSEAQETGPNKPLGFELRNLDSAHPYLAERGLSGATIAEFGLGCCNNGSMKGRIVIPIHNVEGKLVAYAGRWTGDPPEDTPKYKLPAGFRKSEELFNIHRALQADPSMPLVIVEGFFDCIHLCQNGIVRVVALMGSQLSQAQEELIAAHLEPGDRIILMLDEDDAGRAGREHALQRLAKRAFVKVFRFAKEDQQPTDLSAEELQSLTVVAAA